MFNQALLRNLIIRTFTGRKGPAQVCDKSWVLWPYERKVTRPSIYLEHTLDRVTGVCEFTNLQRELKLIQGGDREYGPTLAYQVRDVEIIDGHFYKGAMKYSIKEGRDKLWLNSTIEEIREAQLVASWYGNRFFGHWLRDEPTASIMDFSPFQQLSVHRLPYTHEAGYRELFQIHSKSIGLARCRELIIFDDYSQNSFKQRRYEHFRAALKERGIGGTTHPGVFIRRGTSGVARTLVNERAIEEFLQSIGFAIIDQESLSVPEIMQKMAGARVVASVEGSQMAHGIYGIAEGGTFLALQPPYRFNNPYKDYADCLDVNYSFIVGEEAPGGFIISLEDLQKTLDKIPD